MPRLFILLFCLNLSLSAHAARHALVVGNSDYPGDDYLGENPRNDARAIGAALQSVGFTVTPAFDLTTQSQFENTVNQFSLKLAQNDEVVFYYSGHGVQVNGKNYLVPTQARVVAEAQVPEKAVSVDYVLGALTRAGTGVVIIDACRDNPFKGIFKGTPPVGLKPQGAPAGFLVAFAADENQRAATGSGDNSPYVLHLQEKIAQPGLSVFDVFTQVRDALDTETHGKQQPMFSSRLNRAYCFAGCDEPDDGRVDSLQAQLAALQADIARMKRDKEVEIEQVRQKQEEAEQLALHLGGQPQRDVIPSRDNIPSSGKAFRDCADCPEMVYLQGGTFQMGSDDGDGDEKPVHSVTVEGFALGKYEVTFAEYDQFCEATRRDKPKDEGWGRGKRPVINVSWNDAVAYTDWLSAKTGKTYRLPTEAEWEYAARGGTTTKYWWGNDIGRNRANCDGCGSQWDNKQTAPVDSFAANPFGLHDTAGNVWEWTCSEYTNDGYNGKENAWIRKNHASSDGPRVGRGGSWHGTPSWLRSSDRYNSGPSDRDDNVGFRLARMF